MIKFSWPTLAASRFGFSIYILGAICLAAGIFGWTKYRGYQRSIQVAAEQQAQSESCFKLTSDYTAFKTTLEQAKKTSPEIDLTSETTGLTKLQPSVSRCELTASNSQLQELKTSLDQKLAKDRQRGTLKGSVLDQKTPVAAELLVLKDSKSVTSAKSGADGNFSIELKPDKYNLEATVTGYDKFSQSFEIIDAKETVLAVALVKTKVVAASPTPTPTAKATVSAKATAKPTATPTPAATAAPAEAIDDGIYSKASIETERGSFTTHLLKMDLANYTMRVDTAADDDCSDNCPVKSLSSFVGGNGGVAGIHGSYFCPSSYKDCSGKTNSFYFKLYNGRLGKKINWSNGLGDFLPFLMINQSGQPQYFNSWSDASNLAMQTGISSRPNLISNGQVVLKDSDLDSDKERYTKSSRGWLAIKGQSIYAAVVLGATVTDSAFVAKALGVDYALNLDGGGSTALYYGGAYKVGPGRELPNAVIFIRK